MPDAEGFVVVRGGAKGFVQEVTAGRHQFTADEPVANGGTDRGPEPYDMLLAGLGSCMSMTIALYARSKQWPLESVTVRLRHTRIHVKDCADCINGKDAHLERIETEVQLGGSLTGEQRSKLVEIGHKCPVHRTLTSQIDIQEVTANA